MFVVTEKHWKSIKRWIGPLIVVLFVPGGIVLFIALLFAAPLRRDEESTNELKSQQKIIVDPNHKRGEDGCSVEENT